MKKALLLLILLCPLVVFAQKKMKEGVVKYDVVDIKGSSMATAGLKGSKSAMYFNDAFAKVDATVMNGMMRTQVIRNYKTEGNVMVVDGIVGKKVVTMDKESKDAKDPKRGFDITYDTKDTRKIMGYNCSKVTMKSKTDNTVSVLYVTDKIMPAVSPFAHVFPDLKGFPLRYEIGRDGTRITYEAKEISNKINAKDFEIPTTGYERMTMEEFQKSLGKMGEE